MGRQLRERWQAHLPGYVSYPVMGSGLTFVTVRDPNSYIYRRDTSLLAVSDLDGSVVWGPIPLVEDTFGPLYDSGRVYTLSGQGTLQAWDALTGTLIYTKRVLGEASYSGATIRDGVLYANGSGSGGNLVALRALDGSVLWSQDQVHNGTAPPTVTSSAVIVDGDCDDVEAFARDDGRLLWRHFGSCSGSEAATAPV